MKCGQCGKTGMPMCTAQNPAYNKPVCVDCCPEHVHFEAEVPALAMRLFEAHIRYQGLVQWDNISDASHDDSLRRLARRTISAARIFIEELKKATESQPPFVQDQESTDP